MSEEAVTLGVDAVFGVDDEKNLRQALHEPISMRRKNFANLEVPPPLPRHVEAERSVTVPQGQRVHWPFVTSHTVFMFKLQGDIVAGDTANHSHVINFLFHECRQNEVVIPNETFGMVMTPARIYAQWMPLRDTRLMPLPAKVKGDEEKSCFSLIDDWHWCSLEYGVHHVTLKIRAVGGAFQETTCLFSHPEYNHEDGDPAMMLSVMSTKGIISIVMVEGLPADMDPACGLQ
jgi:hypothetical protein